MYVCVCVCVCVFVCVGGGEGGDVDLLWAPSHFKIRKAGLSIDRNLHVTGQEEFIFRDNHMKSQVKTINIIKRNAARDTHNRYDQLYHPRERHPCKAVWSLLGFFNMACSRTCHTA